MTKLEKILAFAVPACAMLALAQPAAAADDSKTPNAAAAAAVAGVSAATGKPQTARPKYYCLNVVLDTGSRVSRRLCRTKEDWLVQGIDPDAKK